MKSPTQGRGGIEVCPELGSWFTLSTTDHYHFYLTQLNPFSFHTPFPFIFLSHLAIVDYCSFPFFYIYIQYIPSSITFSQSSPNVLTESRQCLYLYPLSSYLYLLVYLQQVCSNNILSHLQTFQLRLFTTGGELCFS